MLKKTLTLALVALLIQTTVLVKTIPALSGNEKDAALAQRVKAEVMRLGAQARVRVKLKDKSSLEGYISEISGEYFVITDAEGVSATTVAYQQVRQVKRNSLSKGSKIGIGVAAAVGVAIIIAVAAGRKRENDSPCTRPAQIGVPCPPGCVCIAQ